ncbi:hypothetical protein ACGFMM_34185 [Streptomyces sp. NPDC048604]|uniref:hypothetical protein n=1 Tax=Streptomyces sp. NPDC048604 TaxID=3365578 RepID=UPI003721D624
MSDVELSDSVAGFAFSASSEQAAAFVAACAERAGAVAFWALAGSTGQAAPEPWFRALELLWEPGPVDDAQVSAVYDELQALLDAMPEDGGDLDSLAAEACDVVHSALGVLLWGDPMGATQIALSAAEFAAGLGEQAGEDLAARELVAQERDVRAIEAGGDRPDLAALRATSAEDGRQYVTVAAAWHRTPTLRVTATVDRSAVIAKHANAVPHYGVVGRIVEGGGTGRYVRVDRLADGVAEGADAEGVMIRVADDPDVTVDVEAEWVEDWPAVEEAFERDGRRIDWS